MAISFKNVLTREYSGRVGDVVFRNYKGKSVMAKRTRLLEGSKEPGTTCEPEKVCEGGYI